MSEGGARIWDFWAGRYDRLWVQRVSLGPTREALLAQFAQCAPGRLLDMGCGTGQLLGALRARAAGGGGAAAWDYTGVDASAAMLAEARRKFPDARLRCAGVLDFDAAPETFDTVVCAHAFPYMADKAAALARLAGWVRPGGRLLLAQACTESGYDRAVLAVVKRTTSPAQYLSVAALCALARERLGDPVAVVTINRHRGMPSLRLVVWRKPARGAAP